MSGTSDQDDLADRIVARLEASFQAMLREAIAADRAERSEPADAVFNTNQAAKILNISAERLRRLCRAEQITFHLHRGRYSFRQSDLDEYREVYRHPRRSVFRR